MRTMMYSAHTYNGAGGSVSFLDLLRRVQAWLGHTRTAADCVWGARVKLRGEIHEAPKH